jgi:multisubunit Na+/H+ antiporter MnhC subunit
MYRKFTAFFVKASGSVMQFDGSLVIIIFFISIFRRVVNVVCFLLGNSQASECYMPTFRNTLSVPSS